MLDIIPKQNYNKFIIPIWKYNKEKRKMSENCNEKVCVSKEKVDMFLMTNKKYFPAEKMVFLKEKLYAVDESKFSLISCVDLKDPTTLLLVSLFLGSFGVDRFMIGETGMGVLKLLTGGCCGILTIIDWFSIQSKTRELNFNKVMMMI